MLVCGSYVVFLRIYCIRKYWEYMRLYDTPLVSDSNYFKNIIIPMFMFKIVIELKIKAQSIYLFTSTTKMWLYNNLYNIYV